MLIRDATRPDGRRVDVRIEGDTIAAVGDDLQGSPVIDAGGWRVMPGGVDAHVHFREPGAPHKETWATGTAAAAAGGVTAVVDQPNTDPPTIDRESYRVKASAAAAATVDYGLNGGVTPSWDPDELLDQPIVALGEVFMADSTGEMGIDEALFETALVEAAARDLLVTVHAEDDARFDPSVRSREDAAAWSAYRPPEAEIAATERACDLAADVGTSIHLAHASTPAAIDRVAAHGGTVEVTPHHLLLSTDDLDRLGTHGRMNPPLRAEELRHGVYERVIDGTVDLIATDHAPHTRAEKATSVWDAPSGVPGVETMLPLLVQEAVDGALSFERVAELCARRPAERFDLPRKGHIAPGYDADLVFVDPATSRPIRADDLTTACGWTPFEGHRGVFPDLVLVRGAVAYRSQRGADELLDASVGEADDHRGIDLGRRRDQSSSAASKT